jgi:hypothetical protein
MKFLVYKIPLSRAEVTSARPLETSSVCIWKSHCLEFRVGFCQLSNLAKLLGL